MKTATPERAAVPIHCKDTEINDITFRYLVILSIVLNLLILTL